MVIDCHYHLEERLLTIDELIQKMDEAVFPDAGTRRRLLGDFRLLGRDRHRRHERAI